MRAAISAAFLGAALGFAAGAGWQAVRMDAPRLAGYGCEGSATTLYGRDESDFPRCAVIQPRHLPEPTFSLVAQNASGGAYIFETRARFADCMGRAGGIDPRAFPVIYCEKEG
jgi:hypothetical protein